MSDNDMTLEIKSIRDDLVKFLKKIIKKYPNFTSIKFNNIYNKLYIGLIDNSTKSLKLKEENYLKKISELILTFLRKEQYKDLQEKGMTRIFLKIYKEEIGFFLPLEIFIFSNWFYEYSFVIQKISNLYNFDFLKHEQIKSILFKNNVLFNTNLNKTFNVFNYIVSSFFNEEKENSLFLIISNNVEKYLEINNENILFYNILKHKNIYELSNLKVDFLLIDNYNILKNNIYNINIDYQNLLSGLNNVFDYKDVFYKLFEEKEIINYFDYIINYNFSSEVNDFEIIKINDELKNIFFKSKIEELDILFDYIEQNFQTINKKIYKL